MTTAVLSPSEGLISRHLTHWIKVSEAGKGGSKDHLGRGWTYLAAWDIQERVLALDFVELSIPTIYRALKSLIAHMVARIVGGEGLRNGYMCESL